MPNTAPAIFPKEGRDHAVQQRFQVRKAAGHVLVVGARPSEMRDEIPLRVEQKVVRLGSAAVHAQHELFHRKHPLRCFI
jgi:hypothetical protein